MNEYRLVKQDLWDILKERYKETADYDLTPEKTMKNLDHLLRALKEK